ncbi:M23 family metallopeptidase [Sphingomonas desiccabilis]|uniref:M23 family metallopeptidase n=1 Tax=Sphingomonas desiccabilis TaxID=429134 RepID=A0A4Q2IMJ6_9SPHN|nr:M23 family metallopeptidase [Sphingomonas desiccabilis]MBB3912429.1 murein DD-endopeptidase MepM/ murein hydrolase activator NlpD [Sphingomonas desiccabilis]RXZ30550.1 M23 family metallopeptidase [Sphingomonas desiccabilis]
MRLLLALLVLSPAVATAQDSSTLRVSSRFGLRTDPFHGRATDHRGVDLPGAPGTPVLAAATGVVRVAGRRGGYGELIELAHADGSATRYAHLSRILVQPGEMVEQGQVIGRMGSTGRSTGSHLHFEYRVGGVPVDPLRYLGTTPAAPERPRADAPDRTVPAPPHRSRFAQRRVPHPSVDQDTLPSGSTALRSPGP